MTFDTRIVAYLIWGIGTVIVYSLVLRDRLAMWRRYRNGKLLVSGLALFVTALCAFLAITAVFYAPIADIRGFLVAVALGAFFAAGAIMVTEHELR